MSRSASFNNVVSVDTPFNNSLIEINSPGEFIGHAYQWVPTGTLQSSWLTMLVTLKVIQVVARKPPPHLLKQEKNDMQALTQPPQGICT